MLGWCLAAALAAAPQFFVQDLTGLDIEAAELAWSTDQLAQALSERGGVRVVTSAQLASVLGMERQRQLLGCGTGDCMVELGQALGVDVLVQGSLARLSADEVRVSLRTVSASTGQVVRSFSGNARGRSQLVAVMGQAAAMLVSGETPPRPLRPSVPLLVLGGTLVLAGVGALVGTQFVADDVRRAAAGPADPVPAFQRLVPLGTGLEIGGWSALVAGAVTAALGVLLGLLPEPSPQSPEATP